MICGETSEPDPNFPFEKATSMKHAMAALSAIIGLTISSAPIAQDGALKRRGEAGIDPRAAIEALRDSPTLVEPYVCITELSYQIDPPRPGVVGVGILPDGRAIKFAIGSEQVTASFAASRAELSNAHQPFPGIFLDSNATAKFADVVETAAQGRVALRFTLGKELFQLSGVPILLVTRIIRPYGDDAIRCDTDH